MKISEKMKWAIERLPSDLREVAYSCTNAREVESVLMHHYLTSAPLEVIAAQLLKDCKV